MDYVNRIGYGNRDISGGIDDEQDEYTINGKTGTRLSDMGLGWYVGYVETEKETWVEQNFGGTFSANV
ncbi:hypothetical protein [Paenibacillus aceris]|uniref:Beta-lactamase class D n=1 Tax=Paenibacillus aceris TaxID=869555 RepID=A0ABS4HQI3_9BACL|nr:beta-lactamase class D [Paenibacillus aceris]